MATVIWSERRYPWYWLLAATIGVALAADVASVSTEMTAGTMAIVAAIVLAARVKRRTLVLGDEAVKETVRYGLFGSKKTNAFSLNDVASIESYEVIFVGWQLLISDAHGRTLIDEIHTTADTRALRRGLLDLVDRRNLAVRCSRDTRGRLSA